MRAVLSPFFFSTNQHPCSQPIQEPVQPASTLLPYPNSPAVAAPRDWAANQPTHAAHVQAQCGPLQSLRAVARAQSNSAAPANSGARHGSNLVLGRANAPDVQLRQAIFFLPLSRL